MDEVRDSKERPKFEVKPILERAIVLPLEGKGDRSAVDEVNCRPAPLRGASIESKSTARNVPRSSDNS